MVCQCDVAVLLQATRELPDPIFISNIKRSNIYMQDGMRLALLETAMLATATTQDRTDRGYRPAKAAEILGISRATLWRWARDGRLSAKKIGPRTTIFLESDIRAMLATGSAS